MRTRLSKRGFGQSWTNWRSSIAACTRFVIPTRVYFSRWAPHRQLHKHSFATRMLESRSGFMAM